MTEERLKHTLGLVIDFVKFAEAKNGALLATNGVLVVGAVQICSARHPLAAWQSCYAVYLLIFLSLSVLLTLVSFMPFKDSPDLLSAGKPSAHDNLLFFGDIAKYDVAQYLRTLESQP